MNSTRRRMDGDYARDLAMLHPPSLGSYGETCRRIGAIERPGVYKSSDSSDSSHTPQPVRVGSRSWLFLRPAECHSAIQQAASLRYMGVNFHQVRLRKATARQDGTIEGRGRTKITIITIITVLILANSIAYLTFCTVVVKSARYRVPRRGHFEEAESHRRDARATKAGTLTSPHP
jgi:hypothetical protein